MKNGNGITGLDQLRRLSFNPLLFKLVSEVRGRIAALQTFPAVVVGNELDASFRAEVY
jgi:hypothetical protein